MRVTTPRYLAISLSLSIVACGADSRSPTLNQVPWTLTTSAGQNTFSMLVGDQLILRADEIRSQERREVPSLDLIWQIVGGDGASISSGGVLTAWQPGRVVVEARRGSETISFSVTISPRPLSSLRLELPATVLRGDTITVGLTALDDRSMPVEPTGAILSVSDPTSLHALGMRQFLAVQYGTVYLTASAGGLKDSLAITIGRGPVARIGLRVADLAHPGDSLEVLVAPVDRRGNPVPDAVTSVSSGNIAVAELSQLTITGSGRSWLRTRQPGITSIHASSEDIHESQLVTVMPPTLTSLQIAATAPFFFWQDSVRLSATGVYSDGSTRVVTEELTWGLQSGADRFALRNGWLTTVGAPFTGSTRRDIGAAAVVQATLGGVSGSLTVNAGSQRPTSITLTGPASASVGDIVTINAILKDSTGAVVPGNRRVGSLTWETIGDLLPQGDGKWKLLGPGTTSFVLRYSEGGVSAVVSQAHLLNTAPPALVSLQATAAAPFFFWQDSVRLSATGHYSDGTSRAMTDGLTWSIQSGADRFTIRNGWLVTAGAPFLGSIRRDVGAVAVVRVAQGSVSATVVVGAGSQRPSSITLTGPGSAEVGDVITIDAVFRDSTGTQVPSSRIAGTLTWETTGSLLPQGAGKWKVQAAGPLSFTLRYNEGGVPGVVSSTYLISAAGPGGSPSDGYVELEVLGTMSPDVLAAFEVARTRINTALPLGLNASPLTFSIASGVCGSNSTPFTNRTINGLLIYVEVTHIDGPGNILGSAGPCFIRNSTGHPVVGRMTFDEDDLTAMISSGRIGPTILHEMLHVVGIGTLWGGSYFPALAQGLGGSDPRWLGGLAVNEYASMGGADHAQGIPIENTGGSGTRDGHWRESIFGLELMTGWINGSNAPLSRMSLASLADLNYSVNYSAADPFNLNLMAGLLAGERFHIAGAENLHGPQFSVGPDGRVTRVPSGSVRN